MVVYLEGLLLFLHGYQLSVDILETADCIPGGQSVAWDILQIFYETCFSFRESSF